MYLSLVRPAVSQLEVTFAPQEIFWKYLQTFLIVTTEDEVGKEELLVSNGRRPEMLLNIL